MTGLVEQLRSYGERLDASAEPAGAVGVIDGPLDIGHELPTPGPPRRGSQRPGRWVAALAAAAAVLIVAGLVVRDGDDHSVATDGAAEPGGDESDPSPPEVSVWSLVDLEGGESFAAVVRAGPGLVAVGAVDDAAAAWTSVDGRRWTRVPHDETVFGGEGRWEMADVTVGGPGLVAVGSQSVCRDVPVFDDQGRERLDEVGVPEPNTECTDQNAVVWTSADGTAWSRVAHDEAIFGGSDFPAMAGVTAGGPGLVAVGRSDGFGGLDVLVESETPVEGDAVVWISDDGLDWTRVPHDEAVFGGPHTQEMLDVTVGGPGFVAVGRDGAGDTWSNPGLGGMDPAIWTSVDGVTWRRVPGEANGLDRGTDRLLAVTAGGPGLVAVGYDGMRAAPVWTSSDGLSWTRVTHDNPTEMRGWWSDVGVGGPGLVALQHVADREVVVTSPDGLTWSPAPEIAISRP